MQMSRRLSAGNSSGDEERGGLLGNSRQARFELRNDESKNPANLQKVALSTKFLTIYSFSAVLILVFVGMYINSNSRFFHMGPDGNQHRKEKATQVFLAALFYLLLGLYYGWKWRKGSHGSRRPGRRGRIN